MALAVLEKWRAEFARDTGPDAPVLVMEVETVEIIAVAVVTVPIDPAAATVTIEPPSAMTSAATVIFDVPSALARAAIAEAPVLMRLLPLDELEVKVYLPEQMMKEKIRLIDY